MDCCSRRSSQWKSMGTMNKNFIIGSFYVDWDFLKASVLFFCCLRGITPRICNTIINVVRSVYLCLFMLFFFSLRICSTVYAASRKNSPLQKVSLQVKVIKCWITLSGCICTFKPREKVIFHKFLNRALKKTQLVQRKWCSIALPNVYDFCILKKKKKIPLEM